MKCCCKPQNHCLHPFVSTSAVQSDWQPPLHFHGCLSPFSISVWEFLCESRTLAVAQVLDFDALLLLTGRLLHLARVVVGATVWGTHRVEADVGTVDVADAPKGPETVKTSHFQLFNASAHCIYWAAQCKREHLHVCLAETHTLDAIRIKITIRGTIRRQVRAE